MARFWVGPFKGTEFLNRVKRDILDMRYTSRIEEVDSQYQYIPEELPGKKGQRYLLLIYDLPPARLRKSLRDYAKTIGVGLKVFEEN